MKNMLETMQDVLLVFTIIVLVYVLYKRLLIVLGKEKKKKFYPTIGEKVTWKDNRHAILEVTLHEKTHLTLGIFNAENQIVKDVLNSDFEEGLQALDVDCSSLSSGKYYFKITSPRQESSQYFVIA